MIFSKKNIESAQKYEMLISELTELFPSYTFGDSIKSLLASSMDSYVQNYENEIEGLSETIAGLQVECEAHVSNMQSADETIAALTSKFAKEIEEYKAELESKIAERVNKLSVQKLASSGYNEPVKVLSEAKAVSELEPIQRLAAIFKKQISQ